MRAMRAEQFSGYEALKLVEVPKPKVTDGKVLVRIAGLETSGSSDLRRCGGQWLVAQVVRLVDGKVHEVVEIDADVHDGSTVRAERVDKFFGVFYNLCGRMRHRVHAEDGILQVDEDECGLFGVELEFCHASLFVENI